MRKLMAVGAMTAVLAVTAACSPNELNRWGAWARGAHVVPHPDGHPGHYYTGHATTSLDTCLWLGEQDPAIPNEHVWEICQAFRGWYEGDHGYRS